MGTSARRYRGQGLVEFALLLPVLLLIIIGSIEFGRIMFIYVNIANAAREGARYGMVNPKDQNGIINNVSETLSLVASNDIAMNINYDRGPGTGYIPVDGIATGDRVIVTLQYVVQPITPIMQPFMPGGMTLRTENKRTIQTSRADAVSTLAAPAPPPIQPTFTPTPGGDEPPDTFTPAPTETLPPLATATNTPTPTSTATPTFTPPPVPPTATPLPAIIIDSVYAGDTVITGDAAPGYGVTLRVVQTGLQRTVTVGADGRFYFPGLPGMVAGYTVIVQGYGDQDLEVVGIRPTETPTVTPTPSGGYIFVNTQSCLDPGTRTITVSGRDWPTDNQNRVDTIRFYWNGQPFTPELVAPHDYTVKSFDIQIQVPVTLAGPNMVGAEGYYKWGQSGQVVTVPLREAEVPVCGPTPTPSPTASPTPEVLPDLVITNLTVTDDPVPGTYARVHLAVSVGNVGDTDVTSLFWVDLYADPDMGTPLDQQASVDYVAVSALASGSAITFTMYVPDGFATPGDHTLLGKVDTWDQVLELDEGNNVSVMRTITLTVENPTPTPTPVVTPGASGSLSGLTYYGALPQGFVMLYLYDTEGRLINSTRSDSDGLYVMKAIPVGEYTIVGQLRLGNTVYTAVQPVIITDSAESVVDLYLSEL